MIAVVQRRSTLNIFKTWDWFYAWVTSTKNRFHVGWLGVLMIPTIPAAITCFLLA